MLYIVSTPIGNLGDISTRALETLRSVEVILMESPSDSRKLLSAFGIGGKKIFKYNDKNRRSVEQEILRLLRKQDVAYISSAGTPGISDPGSDLVMLARMNDIETRVIPGPSALASAVALSGIRAREFVFASFPPKKEVQLKNFFYKYQTQKIVLVFFESTHRIIKTLGVLEKYFPKVRLCVAKEMTKQFESYFDGTAHEIMEAFSKDPKRAKGEFTLVVDLSS